MKTADADALFEAVFFHDLKDGARHTAATAIQPAGELDALARGKTALRFTTAKAKIHDLSVTETDKGYILRSASRKIVAFDLANWMKADNQVPLSFNEEMMHYEPEEDLVQKSKVPLWIIRPNKDGAVSIERVWGK